MSPSVQKASGNTEFGKQHENGGPDKQQTEKAAKDLDKLDIQMSTRSLRGKTLTSSQKGQLRAILAGAVHTCARMWARGTVVTGLCPACGHENEDLTHQGENTSAHERGSHAPGIQRYDFGSEGHPAPGLGKKQQNQ